ncbi:hypothetical protein [Kitasatospora cineracea]|uniref:Uncharacterized protein n=1 Tax=Kitasatospora cineracea TaxID=88074 RepID=A0A3N4R948_9ACTN|nr:hypothetical protein [Kitasatospora cineracea]RPE27899.1 hypothetical protein EDD38_7189 [Kitasatospora cineracea]
MSVFVSVRGWLECDDEQLAQIKGIIAAEPDRHYIEGWTFPGVQYNWGNWVFFGACMREQYVGWLLDQLRLVARLPASDEDNDRVIGLFLARHEVEGQSEWQVRDGDVVIKNANSEYQYLDAE